MVFHNQQGCYEILDHTGMVRNSCPPPVTLARLEQNNSILLPLL